jgi:HEAT repeat protein
LKPNNINGINVPYEKNTNELIAMLNCEMPLFCVACEALSSKTDELSFTTLLSILKSSDPFKRRVAVECLGNHVLLNRAFDDILTCLDDKSPYVVRTAIDTIIKHRIVKSHEKIIQLIKSRDEAIREKAVSALEYIGTESDCDLALSLFNDKNENIRKLIPYIIFAIASKTNWNKAYAIMKHSDMAKARLVACKLLNKFGSETERNEAKLFLQDKDGHIRKYASKIIDGSATE